ncbi:hypothetical protein KBC04_03755 [Candidatus Babeliales bacterium]|nr:hypothetical protein [Candidatus Babeliales bacterium]MBP9844183.1 hypothetical protein [Candidatus Babeliales bacterium]
MKMNRLLLLSFFMIHFTACQAGTFKHAAIFIAGIYTGIRYNQADSNLTETEKLIGKDAQKVCDKTRLGIELICGEQEVCQSAIKSLQACKEMIETMTNTPKK